MIVISDTTPLRYLILLGQAELLRRLFDEIHCPDVVQAAWEEVSGKPI